MSSKDRHSRAEGFWNAFRFTENGRPKSGFGVYTFSLSIVYVLVYGACFMAAIELLTHPLRNLPAWAGNLIIALLASGVGAAICCLPHRFFGDKRLVFGGHLWLCAYAVAVLVIMLVLVGIEAYVDFLIPFGWFVLPPVAIGTAVSAWLYSRSRTPEAPEEPEWKQYINRR